MRSFLRLMLAASTALALTGAGVSAEDAKAPAQAAPASSAESKAMGCPGKPDGSCCGSSACREAKQESAEGKAVGGGCPCQRAREAAAAQKKGS
jgi:hypothetical protein